MTSLAPAVVKKIVFDRFGYEEIAVEDLIVREYPDETVLIVHVAPDDLPEALKIGSQLDQELQTKGFNGFVTVRPAEQTRARPKPLSPAIRVADPRAGKLIALLTSRSRTSETQPSLNYVLDAAANLEKVRARRHSLIFGRRGAGKTALMLEAKRRISEDGQVVVWLNLQTYRRESTERMTLWIATKICEALLTTLKVNPRQQITRDAAKSVGGMIEGLLGQEVVTSGEVYRVIPHVQRLLHRFCESSATAVYIFLDDMHYTSRSDQPELLDMLHSCVRDADVWLKIAAIRHFANWYKLDPPTGLQAGQDADAIDLDLTLQQPGKAKIFLERVLSSFAKHIGVPAISGLFAADALDRLVLASGAVPRDYLVLAAGALEHGRNRGKSKLVGKQDVARAAGDIAQAKMSELEEDAASASGSAPSIIAALQKLREYCLEKEGVTFFQVNFKDKEKRTEEYSLLQSLMDVRFIHIVNPSVSDMHQAGERAEVYMFDLSQFSGERLRRHLKVLDFVDGHLVLKETGTTRPHRPGDTPRRLITILRSAPNFDLSNFTHLCPVNEQRRNVTRGIISRPVSSIPSTSLKGLG